jgi:hypothetical protein
MIRWLLFVLASVLMYPIVHPTVTMIACLDTVYLHSVTLCEVEYGVFVSCNVFYPAALMFGGAARVVDHKG